MVFMYVPARRDESIFLALQDMPVQWNVVTALNSSAFASGRSIAHTIVAPSYDAFADGPIEIGTFKFFQITDTKPPITVAIHGDEWKQGDVENTLRKICEYEIDLMHGAPYDRYLFIFHIGKAAEGTGGGMEHAHSTAINIAFGAQLSGVSAHEFFHLLYVERISPSSRQPIYYTHQPFTRSLSLARTVISHS